MVVHVLFGELKLAPHVYFLPAKESKKHKQTNKQTAKHLSTHWKMVPTDAGVLNTLNGLERSFIQIYKKAMREDDTFSP